MKTNAHLLSKLLLILFAACPALATAAPPTGSPYDTDKTNSYVQDQTSKAMENLNGILCHVSAMDPADMVGLGAYIALVDGNICNPNDNGGQGGSTGSSFKPAIINSTRASNTSPMIAKVWLEDSGGGGGGKQSIYAYLSATQAPTPPADPYGRFRLDFCGKSGGTCMSKGYINSTASGLAFFSSDTGNWGMGGATLTQTLQLQLNATSSTDGSGALSQVTVPTGSGGQPDAAFYFAYNATHFMRSDSTGAGAPLCFSRDPNNAAESVWSYGVYDSTTGARIERNSGFPIEYTDATSGNTMNGYVGYWGMNSPTPIASGSTVNKVTYGSGAPTKTPYTLLQTGGKLVKFTKGSRLLDDMHKVKFQFWPQTTVTLAGGGSVNSGTGGCSGYEVFWDKTTPPGNFVVTGQQDSNNNCNIKTFATALTMTIAEMKTAAPWGLNGWSQMLGGDFGINSAAMASLSGSTNVVTHTQDIVYPSSFAATFPLGLVCIENCPTAANITASNANGAAASVMPYDSTTTNWNFSTGRTPITYTLNSTTGNLIDSTGTAVVSTASQSSGTTGNYGNNNNGIQSGRLAIKADLDSNLAVTGRTQPSTFVPGTYLPVDFDQLTTYYQWQTGGNNWNQLSVLFSGSTPVAFDPPLNVDFVVPSTGAQYGNFLGASFTLQYGGFGNLWGIPSTCIDVSTNAACLPNGATPNNLQRWTPQFSIPTGSTVSVSSGQSVTAGTSYTVKALQKEVRLGKVDCTGITLTLPTAGTITLPTVSTWSDPSSSTSSTYVGSQPAVTDAPRVIHGVKMY